jgi:hypothetical protein
LFDKTIQLAILILDDYISLNQDQVSGHMIFIAQTTLYLAAKLEQHIDTHMSWPDFEMTSRDVASFAVLMRLYGIEADDFGWEFEMSSLEKHICYLCSYKLNHVTPSQVAEELF